MKYTEVMTLVGEFWAMERTSGWHEAWKSDTYKAIKNAKIFKCGCCRKRKNYFDLERWTCNFDEKHGSYICAICYEDGMGDDL